MKVVVTGGSGELGTLVLRRLLDDRSVKEVVTIDRRPPLVASGKLRTVMADVRDPGIGEHLGGADAVIHLAFIVARHLERSLFDSINVGGSKNVFRAAAAAGVRTIVYSSSVAAYGVVPGHPVPIVEATPRVFQPAFPYAATKFQVEELLDAFEKEHPDVAVARLRPVILVGRDMDHALGQALRMRRLPGGSTTPLPIVWDEDVADALILALKKRARGAFNLAADELLPPAELARRLEWKELEVPRAVLKAGARFSAFLGRFGLGGGADPAWLEAEATLIPSSARAKSELGWKPRCPTAVSVLERFDEVAPGIVDPRIPLFLWMTALATKRRAIPVDLSGFDSRIHLRLDGPRGGDFTITIKDKQLGVAWGAPRPPTATVALEASYLLDLLAGRADPALATVTGKIRVHGEGHAGLVLGGMVSGFRAQTRAPGARGHATRALGKLFAWKVVA